MTLDVGQGRNARRQWMTKLSSVVVHSGLRRVRSAQDRAIPGTDKASRRGTALV
jgi:hypothetical protein